MAGPCLRCLYLIQCPGMAPVPVPHLSAEFFFMLYPIFRLLTHDLTFAMAFDINCVMAFPRGHMKIMPHQ